MREQTMIEPAIAAWRAILGDAGVCTDGAVLDRYARTTQPEGTRPRGVLYPETLEHGAGGGGRSRGNTAHRSTRFRGGKTGAMAMRARRKAVRWSSIFHG